MTRISVMIYVPCRYVVKLNVNPKAHISDLRRLLTLEQCQFVFQGQLLVEARTFQFYRIKNGDTLVVVQSPDLGVEVDKWLSITDDVDSFRDKMKSVLNEDAGKETARIRDMLMTKLERKPRTFRKLCVAVEALSQRTFRNKQIQLCTDFPAGDAPSVEPLPVSFTNDGVIEGAVGVARDTTAFVSEKPVQPGPIENV